MRNADSAKAVFSDLVKALCQNPDKCYVDYSSMPNIRILASPNDAKIIVGRGGRHLNGLAVLARMLLNPSVNIMPVESLSSSVMKDRRFKPQKDWDDSKVTVLLRKLVAGCFPAPKVTFNGEPFSNTSYKIVVTILPTPDSNRLEQFSEAIAVLFVPIGANCGKLVYVNAI